MPVRSDLDTFCVDNALGASWKKTPPQQEKPILQKQLLVQPILPALLLPRRLHRSLIRSLSCKKSLSNHPTEPTGIMLGNKIRPACFPQHRNPACDAAQMMFPSVVCATRRLTLQKDGNLRIDADCTSGEDCKNILWYSNTYGKGVVELRAQVKCSLYLGIGG